MREASILRMIRQVGVRGPLGTLVLALGLGGCADVNRALEPPPVNPSSPIAAYADRVAQEPYPMPNLITIPPKPTDVRDASAYRAAVVDEVSLRRNLLAWRAAHPESDPNTEAWAAQQRARIPPGQAVPVAQSHEADAEAFAKKLRDAAVKPQ